MPRIRRCNARRRAHSSLRSSLACLLPDAKSTPCGRSKGGAKKSTALKKVGRCSARPSAVHGDAGGGGKHRLPARVAGCMAGGKSGNWICYAGARRRRSSASCSCRDDCWVEKYETDARRHPRRCVVAATTNECGVLAGSDWRPPPITSARNSPRPHRAGPIAMVCQALACYCADATWWEFPEAAIADEQEERQSVDGLAGHPQDRIEHGRRSYPQKRPMHCTPWPPGWISSAAIMRDWLELPAGQQGRASSTRLGHATRRLGFKPVSRATSAAGLVHTGHPRHRGHEVPPTCVRACACVYVCV